MVELPEEIDPLWVRLWAATSARIGLPRAGSSLATSALLAFQLAHARARDAVHEPLDVQSLVAGLHERGLGPMALHSAAPDRHAYLARPDLGRRLDEPSRAKLDAAPRGYDIAFAVVDGLSALAVERHAPPLLDQVLPELRRRGWRIGPVAVVEQGRVAIGDEIGQTLEAALVVALIGERPGLTSPDSLGAYITFAPAIGRNDSERNCLSNIRPEGMSYAEAAERLLHLCAEALRRKLTGVLLKDDTPGSALLAAQAFPQTG
ncbi:ethanolamine ammonia-lyase subunit EutC [Methylocapsa sp. S129]|uniref:ethanolamine ammonia-lyase subunit EutC n=1 Tax=Methylocapsa sp. S129 TaxID=1641869 RepID=UPI00131E6A92|nr:ethanolamine ammonia-lyase subunit EutC [Methylocapsa sp. S129]